MARVQRMGRRFYRCFALRRHGSWEAAEAAARLWLRPVLAQLAALPTDAERPTSRNRSGVAGVFFRTRPRRLKSGQEALYPSYVARWSGAPASGITWMFANSGGEDGAFLRACLSRELRTVDRLRVEWAVRSLSPERRDELLARKRPLPTHPPTNVRTELDEIAMATGLPAKRIGPASAECDASKQVQACA